MPAPRPAPRPAPMLSVAYAENGSLVVVMRRDANPKAGKSQPAAPRPRRHFPPRRQLAENLPARAARCGTNDTMTTSNIADREGSAGTAEPMERQGSRELFARARRVIPGGVN